ncbi:MAG TPA: hypothetical protein VFX98_17820 [Longimicrobiaceae bacterium]|nr:hypothetical protein [Longimicrobiaceae bacterium]
MSGRIVEFEYGRVQFTALTFQVDSGEDEVFLSFSRGMEHGPVIERPGNDSPRSRSQHGEEDYTTDPELQRLGSWFVSRELQLQELLSDIAHAAYLLAEVLQSHGWNPIRVAQELRWPLGGLDPKAPLRGLLRFLAETKVEKCGSDRLAVRKFGEWEEPEHTPEEPPPPLGDYLPSLEALVSRGATSLLVKSLGAVLNEGEGASSTAGASEESPQLRKTARLKRELRKWLVLLENDLAAPCHLEEFAAQHGVPATRLAEVSYQGCGDLSMNYWNVAFIAAADRGAPPTFVYPFEEPVEDRTYTCLVRWDSPEGRKRVEITDLQFNRYARHTAGMVLLPGAGEPPGAGVPVGDRIAFAVSGQQIIREGCELKLANTIHQFSDLRHVFQLPNLNPDGQMATWAELGLPPTRPRSIFNRSQDDDVWLGEHALLRDRNLRRAALFGPILLSRDELGTTAEHIEAALADTGPESPRRYERVDDPLAVLRPGQYRVIREGRQRWYDIYFCRNVYPYSVLGILESGELLSFAWRGPYSDRRGFTIPKMVELLLSLLKVQHAILVDEGGDVFQYHGCPDDRDRTVLPPTRNKVRAMFFMAPRALLDGKGTPP